jgi:hypothetical protein
MSNSASWTHKILDNVLSSMITFIISTMILGSCTYLFFNFNKELNSADQSLTIIKTQIDERDATTKLLSIYANGWFLKDEGVSKLSATLTEISGMALQDSLDPAFKHKITIYIDDSNSQLQVEIGKIKGITVTNNIAKNQQTLSIDNDETLLALFKSLNDLILHWDTTSPENRLESLGKMNDQENQLLSNITSLNSSTEQLIVGVDRQQETIDKLTNDAENTIRVILLKRNLSKWGIFISATTLIVSIVWFLFQRRRNKVKVTEPPHENTLKQTDEEALHE